ncbi:winged helix-turn-helix transcriptional regulator [Sphingomonas sp.]|uniref:winged helix-turn-helix transcriptional regulator n=1 Tax=Sphingomonas sp. TaxID=28214 RepID=UPI00345C057D
MDCEHQQVWGRPMGAPLEHNVAGCAKVAPILQRIGDKWSILIVAMLSGGPRRFNELKRAIGGISQRMLTLSLRGLERDGLVTRTVTPTIPPRVDYALTPLGQSLEGPVSAISNWASAHHGAIEEARRRFDAARDDA